MASTVSLVFSESHRKSQRKSHSLVTVVDTRALAPTVDLATSITPLAGLQERAHILDTPPVKAQRWDHSAESQHTHSAYLSDSQCRWQKHLHSSSAGRRKLKMCEQMCMFIFPQRKTWQIVPGASLACFIIKSCILKFTPQLSVDIAHWFCSTAQCLGCVCA